MPVRNRQLWDLLQYSFSGKDLERILKKTSFSPWGSKDTKIDRLLNQAEMSIPAILMEADIELLKANCVDRGLPDEGSKGELVERLLSFSGHKNLPPTVESQGLKAVSKVNSDELPRLEVTRENIESVLSAARLSSRIRDEYDAQGQIFQIMSARFGPDLVGRERGVGGYSFTLIDIDINGEFAIEVKHADSLLTEMGGKANEVQRLLGQIVLYGRQYKPENIFVAVCGNIEPTSRAPMGEIKKLVVKMGAGFIHVPEP